MAPATENAGVIRGSIGKPWILAVVVVLLFKEPLEIGVAVTTKVLDAAAFVGVAVVLLVSLLNGILVVDAAAAEAPLVDLGVL